MVLQFLQEKELFETLLAMEGETGVKYAATQHLQAGMHSCCRMGAGSSSSFA